MIGAGLIVAGLAIAFAGVRIFNIAFVILVFLSGFTAVFLLGYNILPANAITYGSLAGVGVAAALAGSVAAYCLNKVQKEWAFPVFTAWAAVMGSEALINLATEDGRVQLVVGILSFAIGLYVGYKCKLCIKAGVLAFLGTGLFLQGVALYAGGFKATKWSAFVYLGGFAVMGAGTWYFQRRYFQEEYNKLEVDYVTGDSRDAFADQDEGDFMGVKDE